MDPVLAPEQPLPRVHRLRREEHSMTVRAQEHDTVPADADESVRKLRETLVGPLLVPGDADYDATRTVWNGMIDRRPRLIARCLTAADVAAAVGFARAGGLLVAVRGGDHSAAGNAVCDDGLMIDLSLMDSVEVDPAARTVRVGPGARWVQVDAATQQHGLATTGGTVSDTGVAGLTLGGGLGWLGGRYGLASDNLLEADVLTADGRALRAAADENADLFWALRGGSGNFGVVTSFTFALHPVGPIVTAGMVLHPLDRAGEVLRFYREYVETAPDEVTTIAALMKSPDGVDLCAIAACHCGSLQDGARALRPLQEFGPPLLNQIGQVPYTAFQQALDPSVPRGRRYYWKSSLITELSDDAITTLVQLYRSIPSPMSMILLQGLGNTARRIDPDATAFPHRSAQWDGLLLSGWEDPALDNDQIRWTRAAWAALQPFSTGVYVNGVADGDPQELAGAYGNHHTRLAEIKAIYDPTNLFRLNANIPPQRTPA
jgi:FAD/FMN-containing dehydrogenase